MVLVALVGGERPAADSKIQLQLNWYPEAQFGGYYVAKIHGQ